MQTLKKLFTFRKSRERGQLTYKNDNIEFSVGRCFWVIRVIYEKAGYFDERPGFTLAFLFFYLHIYFNVRTGIDECDPPNYGFYIAKDNPALVIEKGDDRPKFFYFPWQKEWFESGTLGVNKEWMIERKGQRLDLWKDEYKGKIYQETHPYRYVTKGGQVQEANATISRQYTVWRWRWLMWSPFPSYRRDYIDVSFDQEMGNQRGSWKGGVTGTSFTMKPGETMLDTLTRMQTERNFCR